MSAPLVAEALDLCWRHCLAVALHSDDDDGVLDVVLPDSFADVGGAVLGAQVEVHEDEVAGVQALPRDGYLAVQVDEVVAAGVALAGAGALGGPAVGHPGVPDLLGPGVVVVAEQHRVEVDVRLPEHLVEVPVGVGERREQAVGDECRVLRVMLVELVVQVGAPGLRDVVQAVEDSVADSSAALVEAFGEPQRLEEVEPLGVAGPLVVADDGEKRDVVLAERTEDGDGAEDVPEAGAPVVIEVARVDDRVDVRLDGVVDD